MISGYIEIEWLFHSSPRQGCTFWHAHRPPFLFERIRHGPTLELVLIQMLKCNWEHSTNLEILPKKRQIVCMIGMAIALVSWASYDMGLGYRIDLNFHHHLFWNSFLIDMNSSIHIFSLTLVFLFYLSIYIGIGGKWCPKFIGVPSSYNCQPRSNLWKHWFIYIPISLPTHL